MRRNCTTSTPGARGTSASTTAATSRSTPDGPDGPSVDLYDLVLDLQRRGLGLPLLMRFSDILHSRVKTLFGCFDSAIREYGYQGPLSRRLSRSRSTSSTRWSRSWCGSGAPTASASRPAPSPSCWSASRCSDNPDALLILNGYKDVEYMETALLAQKLGRYPIIVIDRYRELELLLQAAHGSASARTSACAPSSPPRAPASGWSRPATAPSSASPPPRWCSSSTGCATRRCSTASSCSTSTSARRSPPCARSRTAMREACRIYVELAQAGAGLKFIDVGGGLGVDYDGSSDQLALVDQLHGAGVRERHRGRRPGGVHRARTARTPTSSPSRAARWSRTTRCWCSTSST